MEEALVSTRSPRQATAVPVGAGLKLPDTAKTTESVGGIDKLASARTMITSTTANTSSANLVLLRDGEKQENGGVSPSNTPSKRKNRANTRVIKLRASEVDALMKDGENGDRDIQWTPAMLEAMARRRLELQPTPSKIFRVHSPQKKSFRKAKSDGEINSPSSTDTQPKVPSRCPSNTSKEERIPAEPSPSASTRWQAETDCKSSAARNPPRTPTNHRRTTNPELSESVHSSSRKKSNQHSSNVEFQLRAQKHSGHRHSFTSNLRKTTQHQTTGMDDLFEKTMDVRAALQKARESSRGSVSLSRGGQLPRLSTHSAPVFRRPKRHTADDSSSDEDQCDSICSGMSDPAQFMDDFATAAAAKSVASTKVTRWGEQHQPAAEVPSSPHGLSPRRHLLKQTFKGFSSPVKGLRKGLVSPGMRKGLSPVKGMRNLFRNLTATTPDSPPLAPLEIVSDHDDDETSYPPEEEDHLPVPDVVVQRGVERNVSDITMDKMFTRIRQAGVTDEMMEALAEAGLVISEGIITD